MIPARRNVWDARGEGMNAAYRSKLRNWLTSMLVLLLIHALLFVEHWYFHLSHLLPHNPNPAMLVLESIILGAEGYVVILIVCFAWHFADFVERGSARSGLPRFFDHYRVFLAVLCFYGAGQLFLQSSFLNDLGCPEIDFPEGQFGFDGCGAWTPDWKMWISVPFAYVLPILSLGKVALSIASQFGRLRSVTS